MMKNTIPITLVQEDVIESNDPWTTIDRWFNRARDFFAAVGMVCTAAFLIGLYWGYFK